MKGLKLATAVVACSLFLVSPVLASRAEASRAAEDPDTYAELLALLEREIGAQLTRHLQEEGRLRQVTVSVAVDPQKRRMVVDFGPGYLPGDEQNYGELFLIPLAADLRHYSDQAGLEILDVEFLFQGKPIDAHFPEDRPMPRAAKSRSAHNPDPRTRRLWFHRVMDILPCIPAGRGNSSALLRSACRRTY